VTAGGDPPRPRGWVVPVVAGFANLLAALAILALGVRYDDQGKTPGTLVWVGVCMLLPGWMVAAILQRLKEGRWERETREFRETLRLGRELAALAERPAVVEQVRGELERSGRHSLTGVVQVVERMLPPDEGGGEGRP
jgi:hypothetical protein